ncbi:MAG: hypothetical protein FWF99_04570 [Desulfovibrionaceae bacterium]|nr:hypothetical protein [Desulfovibrionaceae bacterium]
MPTKLQTEKDLLREIRKISENLRDLLSSSMPDEPALATEEPMLLARLIPGITPEEWAGLARKHDLRSWVLLPLGPEEKTPKADLSALLVRPEEKQFLFQSSSARKRKTL